MNPSLSPHIRIGAVVLFALASVATAFWNLNRLDFYQRQTELRLQEQVALEEMTEKILNQRAAFDWISGTAKNEDKVAQLIKRHLSGVKVDFLLRDKQPAGQGWMVQAMDLRIDRVSPEKLSGFLVACENARPPVRLIDVQVSAAVEGRGGLAVQLALAELNPPVLLSNP